MIQVINRAFDILEFIAEYPESPKSLGEIAGKLNLNAGTCANIIKTLVHRKYLDKLDRQKGYCLGAMAFGLSGNESYKKDLTEAAKDELNALTKEINENTLLAVLNGNIRVAILRAQGTNDIQATTPAEKTAYETTSGRLLVAMLADDELDRYIAKYGLPDAAIWPEASGFKNFQKEIQKIRKEQSAIQFTTGGIAGISVPVFNEKKVVASIGLYMPVFRFKTKNRAEVIKLMTKYAHRITKNLK